MENKKGHVYKKDTNWIFRWVYLIEDGDAVHMKEIPLSPEYIHTVKEGEKVEVYVVESEDGTSIAKLVPRSPYDLPYSNDFPDLWVKNVEDGSVHEVFKYIKDHEGEIHIWCSTWYGHHRIGRDCIFTKKKRKDENANR
jgi:hypothetical protein